VIKSKNQAKIIMQFCSFVTCMTLLIGTLISFTYY